MATDERDNQTTDLFSKKSAESIHNRLVGYLKVEQDFKSWQEFTLLILEQIPALKKAGRPSSEEIKNSFVGKLGFSSWKAYVTSSQDIKGLAWSESRWKRFKEAHQLTRKYKWLTEAKMTPDQIRNLTKKYGDDDGKHPWPTSLDEHIQFEANEAEQRRIAHEQKKLDREQQIADLALMPQLRAEINQLRGALQDQRRATQAETERVGSIKTKLNSASSQIERYKTAIQERTEKISVLEHDIKDLKKRIESLENESTASYLKRAWRALF